MPLLSEETEQPGLLQYAKDYIANFGRTLLGAEMKRRQFMQDTLSGTNARRSMADLSAPSQLPDPINWQSGTVNRDALDPWRNYAFNIAMMTGPNVTAYHGSPYRFDKFSMDKIGTGEGGQAYGHGLYFAEHPETARHYQEVTATANPQLSGRVKDVIKQFGGDEVKARAWINDAIKYNADSGRVGDADFWRKALNNFDEYRNYQGNLYKVDIADDAVKNFLDWDKPLSQQPESVRNILSKWQKENGGSILDGKSALKEIAFQLKMSGRDASPAAVSQQLKEMGIPGIRYLDQGSRGTGTGTSNYVVFDDELVKILSRE